MYLIVGMTYWPRPQTHWWQHTSGYPCKESFLHLLSYLWSVTAEKCRDSTLVLGPVETVLRLSDCGVTKVIAARRQLSSLFQQVSPSAPDTFMPTGNQRVTLATFTPATQSWKTMWPGPALLPCLNYWNSRVILCRESNGTRVPVSSTRLLFPLRLKEPQQKCLL